MNLGKTLEEKMNFDGQLSGEQTGLSAKLFHAVNEEYKIEVDRTFERLRSAELQGNPYEQTDYRRVAFKNEEQAAAFQNYMQEHNINAVMPSVRINGQYLVEIPKIVKIKEIQDKAGSVSPDDNLFQIKDTRESQGAEFLTSTDMLAAYYGDTGEELDNDEHTQTNTNKHYDNNEDYNKVREVSAEVNSSLMSHLDGISEVYNIIRRVSGTIEKYKLYDEEKNLFETKEHSEKERGWDEVYSPRTRSRNKETAVVLNNDIVMINGQVVTDKAVCDNILKRHHERMAKANAISSTAVSAPTTISAIGSAIGTAVAGDEYRKAIHREENNANVIQAQVYQQEYTVYTRTKTEGMLFHGGVMNEIAEQVNAGNVISHIHSDYHLKKEDTADTFNRMNEMLKDDENRFSSVQRNLLEKINNGLHDGGSDTLTISLSIDDRENMKHMLHTASARAYVVRGSENNAIAHLQTAMTGAGVTEALSQLSETEHQNVVESLKRFAKTKDENLSDIANTLDSMERTVIMKLDVNPNTQLSASEEKALQSALTKQSAESTANKAFRKKADEIGKLMKFDEQETLLMQAAGTEAVLQKIIDYEKAQNAYNPDYEPMKIGEMNSGDLEKYTAKDVERMGISEKDWNAANAFMQNKDKMMANFSTLKALEKDFGIKISDDEPLTRERLLKVNEAFLKRASENGYQFVKPDGTFDVDALKALNKDELKTLGISEKTRDMLVKVNTDSEWGFDIKKFNSDSFRIFTSVLNTLTKEDEEMAKTRQDFKLMKRTVKYTKKSAASVYRTGKAVKMRVSTFRLKHHSDTGVGNAAAGTKADAFEKAVNSARERAVNLEANDKYALKMEKKLERVKRDENSILNKGSRWVQDQKERVKREAISQIRKTGARISAQLSKSRAGRAILSVANKIGNVAKGAMALTQSLTIAVEAAKAAASKIIAIGAAILLLIVLQCTMFIAIMMSIASLTEADYTDKVAYVLYDTLKTQEDKWLDNLENADVQFDKKEDKKYGVERVGYEYYVERVKNLMLDNDGKLRVNPFNETIIQNDYDSNIGYLPEVKKYDGRLQSSVGANISMFGRRDTSESGELSFDSGTSSIENGHTSNIKDILAMTDTMYKMDTGGMTDAILYDIMGVTPATINWANNANVAGTFFKWIGAKIGWYSGDDVDRLQNMSFKDAITGAESGTVSYGAIESYVFALWESSHQEQLFLQTEFYPVLSKDAEVNIKMNGSNKNIRNNLKQPQASELGYCVDPVTNKFPIFWVDGLTAGNHISPYIKTTDEYGNEVKHSTAAPHCQNNGYAIEVTIQNLKEDETPCLWEGMKNEDGKSDETTWKKIDENSNIGWGNNCWEKTDLGVEEYGEHFSTGWYDSKEEAKKDIENQVEPKRNEWAAKEPLYEISKGGEEGQPDKNDYFKKTWYTNPSTVYQNDISYEEEVTEYKYVLHARAWTPNGGNKTSWTGGGIHDLSQYSYTSTSADDYKDIEDYVKNTCNWVEWWDVGWSRYENKHHYKASVNARIADIHRIEYNRNCKGHDFEYCGGHVNIHTQGVVFSATNEQMAIAGVADPAPKALIGRDGEEYKLENYGYDSLHGKYVDINYETFASTRTNHAEDYRQPQGSYVASQIGLNLWRSDDGEQWVAAGYISDGDANKLLDTNDGEKLEDYNKDIKRTGIQISDSTIDYFIRDIFDVDCELLKAKNIFPCRSYKDYEGWTADNMQLALMKLSTDWTDMYGFEVPLEIGDKWVDTKDATLLSEGTEHTTSGYTLSQKDVSTVMDLLDKQYGTDMTPERKKAAELALSWVGKGHYSDYHTAHDFLSKTCDGTMKISYVDEDGNLINDSDAEKFAGCCTASDNIGFINYIYNASGAYSSKIDYRESIERDSFGNIKELGSSGNANYAKPCDLLVRRYFQIEDMKGNTYLRVDVGETEWKDEITQEVLRKYRGADAVIYIGTFDETTLGGSELELSGGQKIHAGVPVTIDLAEIHGVGNIYLHTEKPEKITDLNGDTNYWWVIPENRTGFYSSVFSLPLGNMW